MYNVKIIKYPSGYQVRTYSSLVGINNYLPPDDILNLDYLDTNGDLHTTKLESENGRFTPTLKQLDLMYCPFTEQMEFMQKYDDMVRDKERSEKNSMNRTINKVYELSRSNHWDWFVTLTFNPQKVNSLDYAICAKKLSDWLKNARKRCPNMVYLVVPEKHKSGRYHFHGLFYDCNELGFVDSGKRKKDNVIYNVGSYKLGFTTATKVKSEVCVTKYICKYISKELCATTFGKKRYWVSRNAKRAETIELILDPEQIKEFIAQVSIRASYTKQIKKDFINTTYFETNVTDLDNSIGYIAL